MASQLSSYEQMEREARKYRHDFRHHNRLILEYAKKRDCDAIIHYLQEYETIAESRIDRKFCENLVVNSIVSVFFRQAEDEDVPIYTPADQSPRIPGLTDADNTEEFDRTGVLRLFEDAYKDE